MQMRGLKLEKISVTMKKLRNTERKERGDITPPSPQLLSHYQISKSGKRIATVHIEDEDFNKTKTMFPKSLKEESCDLYELNKVLHI